MKKIVLTVMAIVAMTSVSASAGVIAHYSFDSDFTDSASGNDLTKVEQGGATAGITTTAGEYVFGGGALDVVSTVSNQAYLNLASPITMGASDAWSVAFWARRAPGSDKRQGMVLGDTSNSTDFIWLSDNSAQVQGLRFRNSDNVTSDFGGFPDDSLFHHWVVIADGAGSVTAYRDNVSQGSLSASGAFSITSVAAAYNATTHTHNGQMDELYIFDEAIDAATVSSLYGNNVVPEPATLGILALGGLSVLRRRKG